MKTLRISAISYLNTIPFIYGITHSGFLNDYLLEFDVPSQCAEKLIHGQTDIGIVPVAAIPQMPDAKIITDFCIGAVGKVQTVILIANTPLEKLTRIYLDTDSRTSAMLTRILFRHYWKKQCEFLPLTHKTEDNLAENEGMVLIGDKTFQLNQPYSLHLDLAEEWMNFTGLPFVFACWVSNVPLSAEQIILFEKSIRWGIDHRPEAILNIDQNRYPGIDVPEYLLHTISYSLDEDKRAGMALFLKYCSEM